MYRDEINVRHVVLQNVLRQICDQKVSVIFLVDSFPIFPFSQRLYSKNFFFSPRWFVSGKDVLMGTKTHFSHQLCYVTNSNLKTAIWEIEQSSDFVCFSVYWSSEQNVNDRILQIWNVAVQNFLLTKHFPTNNWAFDNGCKATLKVYAEMRLLIH